jgi:hypothetical protein
MLVPHLKAHAGEAPGDDGYEQMPIVQANAATKTNGTWEYLECAKAEDFVDLIRAAREALNRLEISATHTYMRSLRSTFDVDDSSEGSAE